MAQPNKVSSSKIKRSSKDREKRKSFASNSDSNCNSGSNTYEKLSPTRESHSKRYAGLSADNIRASAEHMFPDILPEDLCDLIAEDLNYKLRYIIHQASNRAIISNRTAINSNDVEETFGDLNIDKVYGAPADPIWIPIVEQNSYLYLDDPKINIIEEAEGELAFSQPADPVITKSWLPECNKVNKSLKNYFKIISEAIISNELDLRKMALQNVSLNPNIGPIIEWFYMFGYMLLSKDVTYDSLTLYALDLIETLEMSPLGNTEVDEKQLKLLVRLILQRLLKSVTNPDVLKPMCWVLGILCRRYPLRELVLAKLTQKLPELSMEFALPVITIVNALGVDAIETILVKNIAYFLSTLVQNWKLLRYAIMETYYTLYKNDIYEMSLYYQFPEMKHFTIMLSKPQSLETQDKKREIDFITMRKQLIKTRRKIDSTYVKIFTPYEDIFEVPIYRTRMKLNLENHYKTNCLVDWKKQTHIIVGKTSVLLPVLKNKNTVLPKCCDHSLFSYNL